MVCPWCAFPTHRCFLPRDCDIARAPSRLFPEIQNTRGALRAAALQRPSVPDRRMATTLYRHGGQARSRTDRPSFGTYNGRALLSRMPDYPSLDCACQAPGIWPAWRPRRRAFCGGEFFGREFDMCRYRADVTPHAGASRPKYYPPFGIFPRSKGRDARRPPSTPPITRRRALRRYVVRGASSGRQTADRHYRGLRVYTARPEKSR